MSTERLHIIKQIFSWKLQVCLSMYDLLVDTRRYKVKRKNHEYQQDLTDANISENVSKKCRIWDLGFKIGPNKICEMKNSLYEKFEVVWLVSRKVVFHNFYIVNSWVICTIFSSLLFLSVKMPVFKLFL